MYRRRQRQTLLVLSTYVRSHVTLTAVRSNPVRILPKIPGKMQMQKSAKIPKNAKLRRSAMQLQSLLQRSAIGRSLSLSSTFLLRCNEKCPSSTRGGSKGGARWARALPSKVSTLFFFAAWHAVHAWLSISALYMY